MSLTARPDTIARGSGCIQPAGSPRSPIRRPEARPRSVPARRCAGGARRRRARAGSRHCAAYGWPGGRAGRAPPADRNPVRRVLVRRSAVTAVRRGLAASGQVDEHVIDVRTKCGLFGRQPDGLAVYGIERSCDLADVFTGVDGHRFDLDVACSTLGGAELLNDAGKAPVRDIEGGRAEDTQRLEDRPGHHDEEDQTQPAAPPL